MMKIGFFVWILVLNMALGVGIPKCFNNTQPTDGILIETLKQETTTMLAKKENKLKQVIKKYKEALAKKRERMLTLWKTTTEIEFLMKENQVIRRRMIKHWESVKNTH